MELTKKTRLHFTEWLESQEALIESRLKLLGANPIETFNELHILFRYPIMAKFFLEVGIIIEPVMQDVGDYEVKYSFRLGEFTRYGWVEHFYLSKSFYDNEELAMVESLRKANKIYNKHNK
jgi:hypothetical protein